MENPLDVRDPTALVVEVRLPEGGDPDAVVRAVDEEIARLATDGVSADELRRVMARTSAELHQLADNVMERTLAAASYEQQRGRAELVWEVPDLLQAVTPEQVTAAAATLTPTTRARLDIVPGSAS
jgi:predicted Zn-dependent peptidase